MTVHSPDPDQVPRHPPQPSPRRPAPVPAGRIDDFSSEPALSPPVRAQVGQFQSAPAGKFSRLSADRRLNLKKRENDHAFRGNRAFATGRTAARR